MADDIFGCSAFYSLNSFAFAIDFDAEQVFDMDIVFVLSGISSLSFSFDTDNELIAVNKVMTIEETLQIALDAHKGQKDLDGNPAVLHPVAVGLMGSNDAEIKTGFLHDVVEDTDLTIDDLRGKGMDEEVLAALELLTHDKGTDYFEYVHRIAHSGNYRH